MYPAVGQTKYIPITNKVNNTRVKQVSKERTSQQSPKPKEKGKNQRKEDVQKKRQPPPKQRRQVPVQRKSNRSEFARRSAAKARASRKRNTKLHLHPGPRPLVIVTNEDGEKNYHLPESTGYKSLSPNHPDLEGGIQHNLKLQSSWYQAIRCPKQAAGIRMPDESGMPTGTLQMVKHISFSAGANLIAGVRTVCLLPNDAGSGSAHNYELATQATNPAANKFDWDTTLEFPSNGTLQGFSEGVRVVSASLSVQSLASISSSSGAIYMGFRPYEASAVKADKDINDYIENFGTCMVPLNTMTPTSVVWIPVNVEQEDYAAFYPPNFPSTGDDDNQCPRWELWCLADCPQSTEFVCELVVNYEFIPRFNALDILSAVASPVDLEEETAVIDWVAEEPNAGAISQSEMSAAPSAEVVEELPQDGGDTGFGFFYDVLEELVPIIELTAGVLL